MLRVLKKAGLTKDDVDLVEMPSVEDVYVDALGSKQVDVAPLGGVLLKRYLAKYGKDGAHRDPARPARRPVGLYVADDGRWRTPTKAAALREYVAVLGARPGVDVRAPGGVDQGLLRGGPGTVARTDGQYLVDQAGEPDIPSAWTEAIARHQETVDLLAEEQDHPHARRRRTSTTCGYEHVGRRRDQGRRASSDRTSPNAAVRDRTPTRGRPTSTNGPRRRRLGPGRAIPFGWLVGPVLLAGLWCLGSATGVLDERTLSAPWTVVATGRAS